MNDRKQYVIKMAHQLFMEKGFQATSIQDILEISGISKGTFYNYFSSKNELFIALFKTIYNKLEKDRNELLMGQDPANIDIFIKQIEFQLNMNRKNKLIPLFEEVFVSNDEDLKQFILKGQLRMLHWYKDRFKDLFGKEKEPYLLDCAIMFMGIIHQNLKFYTKAHDEYTSIHEVVRYSVARLVKIVEEVSIAKDQLIDPKTLEVWLPDTQKGKENYQLKVYQSIGALKEIVKNNDDEEKINELLNFIQEELLYKKAPRKYLLETTLLSLKQLHPFDETEMEELQILEQLVHND